MRYLIIALSNDQTAIRVFCELKARHGGEAVKIVSSEELEMATRWAFHLESGEARSNIALASGLTLESHSLGAVYQRIRYTHAPHFAGSSVADREYATAEMHAALLAWLASLPCPVINPPHPMGLGGWERRLFDWLALGIRAGLPVVELGWTSATGEIFEPLGAERRTVLVAGGSVVGDVPDSLGPACVRLAALAGCNLLELLFAPTPGGWRFFGASPYPTDASRIVSALEILA